ncbi:MAG: MqnA/MqnD/SBP family protein [Burkholderiaceae bacterium]
MQPTTPLRILLVNNSSAAAFRLVPPPGDAVLADAPPAATWRAAAAGEADAAIVPVAMLARTHDAAAPAGDFGVSCDGPVGSVLLLSERPVAELVRDGGRVRLSTESETSRRLLRLLVEREFGRELEVAPDVARADAELVIGDVALRARQDPARWPVQVDLCDWWRRQTGLPFVFARWVARRRLDEARRAALLAWLEACTAAAATGDGQERMTRAALAARLFRERADARAYFARLDWRLCERALAGERAFAGAIAEA